MQLALSAVEALLLAVPLALAQPVPGGIETDPGLLPLLPKTLGDYRVYRKKQYDWVKRAKKQNPDTDERGKRFHVLVDSVTATAEEALRVQSLRWTEIGRRLRETEPRDLDGDTLRERANLAFELKMAHVWGFLVPKVFEEAFQAPASSDPFPIPKPVFFVKHKDYLAWKPRLDQLQALVCEADPDFRVNMHRQCGGAGPPPPEVRDTLDMPFLGDRGVPRNLHQPRHHSDFEPASRESR